MSERNTRLQYWLARHKPHSLIAVDEDGAEHKLSVSKKKNRWALVIKNVAAINAVKLRAYDEKGELVTSCDVKRGELDPEDDEPTNPMDDVVPVPKWLGEFASVLATAMQMANTNAIESSDRAVQRMEEAYAGRREDMREAMNQFAVVVKLTTDRLVHLERAWHQLLMRQQELGGMVDPADELAKTVIERAFGDKPNGESKPNGEQRTQKPPKPEPLT